MQDKNYEELWKNILSLSNGEQIWTFDAIITFTFWKYISKNLEDYINKNESEADNPCDYSKTADEEWGESAKFQLLSRISYFIPPSKLFENFVNRFSQESDKSDLKKELKNIFRFLRENSKKELLDFFSELDLDHKNLGNNEQRKGEKIFQILEEISKQQIDYKVFFDFLIKRHVRISNKEEKDCHSPEGIPELIVELAKLNKQQIKSIHDPACGSGSLILKFLDLEIKENFSKVYLQERNQRILKLCKINLILHDLHHKNLSIKYGNTITENGIEGKKVDVIVSNLPSEYQWTNRRSKELNSDERFENTGVSVAHLGDDSCLILHALHHMEESGVAILICTQRVLNKNEEKEMRKYLIRENFVDAVIDLPSGIFLANNEKGRKSIVILKKNKSDGKVLFIDDPEKRIRHNDKQLSKKTIEWILEVYKNKQSIPGKSKLVEKEEIQDRDYELTVEKFMFEEKFKYTETNIEELNLQIQEAWEEVEKQRKKINRSIGLDY